MRKVIFIFAAVLFAGAFAHADMPDLSAGALAKAERASENIIDAARAAVRNSPATAAPAAAAPGARAPASGAAISAATRGVPGTPAAAATRGAEATPTERSATTQPREISTRTAAPIARTATIPTTESRITGARTTSEGAARATVPVARTGTITATTPRIAPGEINQLTGPRVGRAATNPNISRAATTPLTAGAATANYKTCREIYFQCMDEFCANKDAQLKRCACSSRFHEFDRQKKQLNKFTDRMLDFSENLLTVAMDKEDAAAMIKATEGEDAYTHTKDRTQSQQMLDEIMKKLKKTTTDETMNRSLAAINLSMDVSTAFDTIDMTLGAATVAKEGAALYNSARPVCVEMAKEVCDPNDVKTITAAYQMAIEQDCNTVAKTYEALGDAAREKVFEAGALLDMARLSDYQTRNADDILTCKNKMLEMLADNAVCGSDLGKCLDWSGRYINPATGAAILSPDLANLANTISRPNEGTTWARAPGNERFVAFLNAKKKYLEPATANCEVVSGRVWELFVEDALAQIRLSQIRKLEDMRQGCTTLTAECFNATAKSIADFDARALSIFGVAADTAVNKMCEDIKSACSALMKATTFEGTEEWTTGMTDIAAMKTLDQIMITCTEVGRNCIVQNCNNYASKFGLCMLETDVVRRNIVSRRICHNEVEECVGDALKGAPAKTLSTIILKSGEFGREEVGNVYTAGYVTERFYYGPNGEDGGDIIYQKSIFDGSTVIHSASGIDLICKPSPTIDQCRIAERIWGNCNLTAYDPNAKILTSSVRQKSLLAWLAENTGGQLSCDGGDCTTGYSRTAAGCKPNTEITCDGEWCKGNMFAVIGTEGTCDAGNWTNCCESGIKDSFGNCCVSRRQQVPVDVTVNVASGGGTFRFDGGSSTGTSFICAPQSQNAQYIAKYNTVKGPEYLFCLGTFTYDSTAKGTPFNGRCSGKFFIVNAKTGLYSMPMGGYSGSANGLKFQTYHYGTDRQECPFSFNYNGGNPPQWAFGPGWNASCKLPDPNTINKLGNPAGTPRVFIGDPQ